MRWFGSKKSVLGALVVAALVAVVAVGVSKVGGTVRARRAHTLFTGPYQVVEAPDTSYYPPCDYDLEEYAQYKPSESAETTPFEEETETRDLDEVYGAGREQLEAMMQARRQVDAVTGATIGNYLRIPSVYRNRRPSPVLQISYPPDGAVFPPNLCEPRVEWDDPSNALWQVSVGITGQDRVWRFVTPERCWRFPGKVWRAVRELAAVQGGWIQVKGVPGRAIGGPIQASPKVRFAISQWPADNFVVYRLVAPPFNKYKTPDTFVRDIRSFQERKLLDARESYCFNCHTFSSVHARTGYASFQARYLGPRKSDLGVYFGVYDIDHQRGWKVHLPFDIQMTTYMAWSYDSRRLAFSANQKVAALTPMAYETQVAGTPTSDIGIYDVGENTAYLLPGASDPDFLEVFPYWRPDDQAIVFSRAPAGSHPENTRYDLCVVPFDNGKGGTPRPIPGASDNGKSNFYPRFSPDGKWLCFTQARGGDLIRSSSDLYIVSAQLAGPVRRLECNAEYAADSWHSWSSNSHWLVFATKRDDGIYAMLYLTQIDDEGRASPAIRIPLEKAPLASYNIPEFVAEQPRIKERKLFDAIRVDAEVVHARKGS